MDSEYCKHVNIICVARGGLTLADYQSLDDVAIDLVQLNRKLASLTENTGLDSFGRVPAQGRWATMTVNTWIHTKSVWAIQGAWSRGGESLWGSYVHLTS